LRESHHLVIALSTGLLLGAAGCRTLPPSKPLDQLTPQELSGHRVFQQNCGSCHYPNSQRPLHGPGLQAILKETYLPSGQPANDERVTAVILHGHGTMPALGNQFSGSPETDQQLTDLLAYLHTL
jgi:mono/diheme cytochrome c family protein